MYVASASNHSRSKISNASQYSSWKAATKASFRRKLLPPLMLLSLSLLLLLLLVVRLLRTNSRKPTTHLSTLNVSSTDPFLMIPSTSKSFVNSCVTFTPAAANGYSQSLRFPFFFSTRTLNRSFLVCEK